MRKILSLILGLLWAMPVFASEKICNLFDKNTMGETLSVTLSSLPSINETSGSCSVLVPIEANTTYTIAFSGDFTTSIFRVGTSDTKAPTNAIAYKTTSSAAPITITSGANAKYMYIQIKCSDIDAGKESLMVVRGDTAPTSYIAYNATCSQCHLYDTASGTTTWTGTPTPTTPVTLVDYTQGNITLRESIAQDSYDATTGKITRRVGVKVLDGTENFSYGSPLSGMFCLNGLSVLTSSDDRSIISTHFKTQKTLPQAEVRNGYIQRSADGVIGIGYDAAANSVDNFKTWLREQYAAGTPVTIYYPLVSATEENVGTEWCDILEPIKIATTKYNESAFSPLNTALANAISVVDTVVSNTITQAGHIATLQAQKQTRPADDPSDANNAENCPAGKKCLLVEDASGIPHWYEIVEHAWDLPVGYTQLQYLRSDGRAYINTNYSPTSKTRIEVVAKVDPGAGNINIVGSGRGTTSDAGNALLAINSWGDNTAEIKFAPTGAWIRSENVNMLEKNRLSLSATKFSVNGDVKETNNTTIPDTDNRPFYIFQRWRPSIASTNDKTQVYEFSICENDILVRNFVPAKNASGVVGMYDTVEGRFYENAGEGSFVAGNPVVE